MSTMGAVSGSVSRAADAGSPQPLLQLDPALFRAGFDRTPFRVRHRLADHPLFVLERLLELSKRLPQSSVEYNAGTLPIGQDPGSTPRNGLSVQDTIARIATCKSWLVLKNIEQDPEYEALLDACLAEVRVLSEPLDPGMCEKEGFIFITSPGSVTPFHIDIEHNFLLQVRGTKFFNIWPHDDRTVLSEPEIESFYQGAHRNLVYKDEYAAKGQCFELHPGDGLHSPITCPHWVKNGDEVSVSFSVTFRTPRSHKRGHVYMMNSRMRTWNWTPKPYGRSPWRDALKSLTWRAISKGESIIGRKKDDHPGGY
jgi:hypothetical protein